MPYVLAAVAVIGVIAGTIQKVQSAQAEAKALEAEGKFAEAASVHEAASVRNAAAFQERQARRRGDILIGKQAAIGAAAGLDIASGSPLFAELENVRQLEMESLGITRSGENVAQSRLFEGQFRRNMTKFQARAIRRQVPWMIVGGTAAAATAGAGAYYGAGGGATKAGTLSGM
jgi:hypothetical protein